MVSTALAQNDAKGWQTGWQKGWHTLNNSVNGAALLAETAVDALCHIDIIARGPPAAIHTLLGFDCDGLRWANGFAELACNAALLACWVPSQGVLATEAGGDGTLFEGVEDGVSSRPSEPAHEGL